MKVLFSNFEKHTDVKKPFNSYNNSSAAYDVYCYKDTVIKAKSFAFVPTNLRVYIPNENKYLTVHLRSSLAKKGLFIHNGIIDGNYNGELKVIIFNFNDTDILIKENDRFCQLLGHKKKEVTFKKVALQKLIDTDTVQKQFNERGSGGFGSSD